MEGLVGDGCSCVDSFFGRFFESSRLASFSSGDGMSDTADFTIS